MCYHFMVNKDVYIKVIDLLIECSHMHTIRRSDIFGTVKEAWKFIGGS